MMRTAPRVTIGMPVYNGEPFLEEVLRALACQTFADYELIVSDNASTDATPEIVDSWARRDPRMRVVRQAENVGAARNYNKLVDEARGEYFKWAAADDVCLAAHVEQCVRVLDARPDVVLAYPKTRIIDAGGRPITDYEDNMHLDHASPVWRFGRVVRRLREANAIFGVMRTEALRRTRLIGPFASSDLVLLGELALLGRFFEVPERLFLRRDHARGSMRAYADMEQRDAWFDPARQGKPGFPAWRIPREYARAVRRSGLGRLQRTGCYLQLVWWVRHKWKEMAGDVGRNLRRLSR
ncbi:MAG: glycosyltransferase family 2 protein [Planctomycetota bacterium]